MSAASRRRIGALLALLAPAACACADSGAPPGPPVHWADGLGPGVNWGLARAYPDDVGIAEDPHVLAAEDFESGGVLIPTENDVYADNVTVVDTVSYTGDYSAERRWPEGENGPTSRFVLPESAYEGPRSTYFVRMCFDYDDSFHPGADALEAGVGVKGFGVEADPHGVASVNTPCDGTNWFNAQVQFVGWGPSQKPEANDGYLWVGHQYSYNPYPEEAIAEVGTVEATEPAVGVEPYRFSSYADPFFYIEFGGWHCYEVGLYLNNPGEFDGEARFWIDGVLQSRVTNIRYRDTAELVPTNMQLNLHRTTEQFPQTMLRWTDNIVLATRYIGPVRVE